MDDYQPSIKLLQAQDKLSKDLVASKLKPEEYGKLFSVSDYQLPEEAKDTYAMILRHFTLGDITMQKPRPEFNDMSVLMRDQIDQMAWNTYQPNNGAAPAGDVINAWKCVSDDTEILTMDGWKGNGDIKVGDKVLTYDLETAQILPDEAKQVFEYDIDGTMFRIKNKHTDQLITPNHRTLVKKWERTTQDGKRIRKWWNKYEYVEAQDLDYSIYDFPLAGLYNGDYSIGEDWSELVGWFLTDGYMKGSDCYITQCKPDSLLKLRTLLDTMKIEYREWSRERKNEQGEYGDYYDEHRFYFLAQSEVASKMKEWIPNRKPTNALLHLNLKEKQRLLLGICLGDGSWDKEYNHYGTVHKPYQDFKEWLQTLLHLMGLVGSVAEKAVHLRYSSSVQVESEDRNEVDYCGKVWSIETERTNYIARRNGHIFITGNSRAVRPIIRNKCISIAAHATAKLIFPKIFAYNNQSQSQNDAAKVMEDLMEWAADQSNYAYQSVLRTITALYSPASIGYTEYAEAYRIIQAPDGNGGYKDERICDEVFSGFQDTTVPVAELYIENFYEQDLQKQGFLLWRRVQSYSLLESKYAQLYPNFKYVKPGVQNVYNDANQAFYQIYDSNMRQEDAEEIIYWNRNLDIKIIMVNGIMLTDHKNPNPRIDKQYPFEKFGYELINNRCFYYKSLAFKLGPDADIINTLYPMIIDGTYLNLMPPMVSLGGEIIGSEVIVPGAVTTLSSPNANLQAINLSTNLKAGMDTMFKVDESINQSSEDPLQSGQPNSGSQTAYEISRLEQNASTVLGLFVKMISDHVKAFGKLRLNDILQYLTIADVDKTIDNPELIYKTFFLGANMSKGKTKHRRIVFDASMPSQPLSDKEQLQQSYQVLSEQGGQQSEERLLKVNPELFRNLKFMVMVTPDVLNPMSEDLERAYALETFDRAIMQPNTNHDELTKVLLLGTSPSTKKDPEKFMAQPGQMAQMGQQPPQNASQSAQSPLQTANNPTRQLSQMPTMAK